MVADTYLQFPLLSKNWSTKEIAEYLYTGFTPEYLVGVHMGAVVNNMSRLTYEDRNAISTYLKNLQKRWALV